MRAKYLSEVLQLSNMKLIITLLLWFGQNFLHDLQNFILLSSGSFMMVCMLISLGNPSKGRRGFADAVASI